MPPAIRRRDEQISANSLLRSLAVVQASAIVAPKWAEIGQEQPSNQENRPTSISALISMLQSRHAGLGYDQRIVDRVVLGL